MSGEELYALYVQAHAERNCGVDAWEELSSDDQETWDRVAQLVGESQ